MKRNMSLNFVGGSRSRGRSVTTICIPDTRKTNAQPSVTIDRVLGVQGVDPSTTKAIVRNTVLV